jgi:hypothetical protein
MTIFGATAFAAGQRLTAAQLQAIATQVDSLTSPGWTAYGTWATLLTATGSNPTQGSSTISAMYRKPADSDICHIEINLSINTGGGFSGGSGVYLWQLPFASGSAEGAVMQVAINESGVALRSGTTSTYDTTHMNAWYDNSGGAISNGGLSTSWTTGDWIKIQGFYRVA